MKTNIVDKIMAYECGEMDEGDTIDFFSQLIISGMAWKLQGSYGRTAQALIDGGILDIDGNVVEYPQ